jgi:hypothetical protein
MGFLTSMLELMVTHHILIWFSTQVSWVMGVPGHLTELPRLTGSLMACLAIFLPGAHDCRLQAGGGMAEGT